MRLGLLVVLMLGVFVAVPGAILVLHKPPATAHAHAAVRQPADIAAAVRDMKRQGYTQIDCLKHHDATVVVCYATDSDGRSVITVYVPAHTDRV